MRLNRVSFYAVDFLMLIACCVGLMALLGRIIELLTYNEFKQGVILAGGLGLTAYVLNLLRNVVHKGK